MPPDQAQSFSDFLVRESGHVDLVQVAVNLVIAAVMSFLLGRLYIYFGRSASDRRAFAAQFVLIAVTTALIIVVVKSSLALSLGLVGALSIVRFRSAVREHEELAFLFLAIALGLCLGADQVALAVLGFLVVALILAGRGLISGKVRHENLFVKVNGVPNGDDPLGAITDTLVGCCRMVKLKRCDIAEDSIEAAFQVEFDSLADLTRAQADLRARMSPMLVSVIDGDGLI